MPYRPLDSFAGGTYRDPRRYVAIEECINLYPKRAQSPNARAAVTLSTVPGLRARWTCGSGPHRGAFAQNGRAFAVSGDGFYEVFPDSSSVRHGDVRDDGQPASLVSNGDGGLQVFIVSGGRLYVFRLDTGAFAQVGDPDAPSPAAMGGYLDGYGLALLEDSAVFQFSALMNFTDWDLLDVAQKSKTADRIRALVVDHGEAWLFGHQNTEPWTTTEDALVPLAPVPGGLIPVGLGARWSVCRLDTSLAWLAEGEDGARAAFRAQGYGAAQISTAPIEEEWATYPTIADARAWSYREGGSVFWVLTFPSAHVTWVYDASLAQAPGLAWHKRLHWDPSEGRYTAYLGATHMYAFERHLVGSRIDGTLYEQRLDVHAFGDAPRRWMRALPAVSAGMSLVSHHALALDCLVGRGLVTGQGRDPQVMLDWSDDGGLTYGDEQWRSLGAMGQFQTRVEWHALGATEGPQGRAYRIAGSDPVPVDLVGAYLDARGGR